MNMKSTKLKSVEPVIHTLSSKILTVRTRAMLTAVRCREKLDMPACMPLDELEMELTARYKSAHRIPTKSQDVA